MERTKCSACGLEDMVTWEDENGDSYCTECIDALELDCECCGTLYSVEHWNETSQCLKCLHYQGEYNG